MDSGQIRVTSASQFGIARMSDPSFASCRFIVEPLYGSHRVLAGPLPGSITHPKSNEVETTASLRSILCSCVPRKFTKEQLMYVKRAGPNSFDLVRKMPSFDCA